MSASMSADTALLMLSFGCFFALGGALFFDGSFSWVFEVPGRV